MDELKQQIFREKVTEEPFARLLGIRLVEVDSGYALCEMEYRDDMDNMHSTAHGGALFSLIDEAFEISSNSHGTVAVALNMNITYMKPPARNALLRAESREIHRGKKTATYHITVTDQEGMVALCQALVYRKKDKIAFLE